MKESGGPGITGNIEPKTPNINNIIEKIIIKIVIKQK